MTLQIDITEEQQECLQRRAADLGLDVPSLVKRLIDREAPQRKKRELTGLGKFAHIRISSDDIRKDRDEEIAKEEAAFHRRWGNPKPE